MKAFSCAVATLLMAVGPGGVVAGPIAIPRQPSDARTQTGIAVYYHDRFQGRLTASGEVFDQKGRTAAHNGYPFGTVVRITNLSNGRSVDVRINDRMGNDDSLLIDVTRRAAEELDFVEAGRARVTLEVID